MEEARSRKLFTYVAYNLRFHPVIERLKKIVGEKGKPLSFRAVCKSYLPNWRPGQDYSKSYSARKELGGGVVLELARSGAEVTGVVSFHGNLDTPNPESTNPTGKNPKKSTAPNSPNHGKLIHNQT